MTERRYGWIAVAALSSLLGAVPALAPGVGAPVEELVRDAFFRARGPVEPVEGVLIAAIDAPSQRALGPWPWSRSTLARVLGPIFAGRPRAVALVVPAPQDLETDFAGEPLFTARRLELAPFEDEAGNPFRPLDPPSPKAGIAAIEPEGVVRRVRLAFGPEDPSIEAAILAARLVPGAGGDGAAIEIEGRSVPLGPGASLRLGFVGPARSFPYLGCDRIARGEFPPATFAGKIVLVGPTDPSIEPGVATPTTGRLPMPRVEVHASALDTLLSGRMLVPLAPGRVALLAVAACLVFAVVTRQVRPLAGVALLAVSLASVPVASYALFRSGVLLPVLPLATSFVACWFGLALLRAAETDGDVERLVDELSRLDRRLTIGAEGAGSGPSAGGARAGTGTGTGTGAGDDASSWAHALDLASLFLDVESMLLFRIDPEKPTHLAFVAGHRATLAEVKERRRDTRRTPYLEATDPRRQVVRRELMAEDLNVSSLLVPILSVTRLLGFLILNRRWGTEDYFAEKRALIAFLSQQLGTLLYREILAARPKARERRRSGGLRRALAAAFSTDRLARRFERLVNVSHSILEKKNLLYSTLNAIDDGVVICDMFGRVVLYNRRTAAISENVGTTIEGKNVIDLIHDLTGLERKEIVRRFSEVVVSREVLDLEIRPPGKRGRHYRMSLSAVRHLAPGKGGPARGGAGAGSGTGTGTGDEGPVLGLVCLFSDITSLKELDQMKTNLLNMVSYRVLNILTSIQGYGEILLDAQGLSDDEREYVRVIHDQAHGLSNVFDSFQIMANLDTGLPGLKMAPVDLTALVRETFDALARDPGLAAKGARLDLRAPERFDIVAADRTMIGRALRAVFAFALENAERGSELKVSIAEEERYLRLDIENRGFGVPREVIPLLFEGGAGEGEGEGSGAGTDASTPSGTGSGTGTGSDAGPGRPETGPTVAMARSALRVVREVFEIHGGTVKAETVIGEGLRFHLWLPLFMKGAGMP